MHLFDQRGIAGETAGIQIAHLIDQGLQCLPCLWIILRGGTNLVQKVQPLFNLALRIGRVGTLPRRYGLTGDVIIADILAAIYVAVAPATAARTNHTIADQTRWASAGLAHLLSTLTTLAALPRLTLLTTLAALPTLTRLTLLLAGLTGAAVLTLTILTLSGLTLSKLRVGLTSAEVAELVAQTR
jgi:hypothetical protein